MYTDLENTIYDMYCAHPDEKDMLKASCLKRFTCQRTQ